MHAISVLNNLEWKGCLLRAEEAKPVPDPLVQKRLQNLIENEPKTKRIKLNEINIAERVKDASTPLWRIPYDKQAS